MECVVIGMCFADFHYLVVIYRYCCFETIELRIISEIFGVCNGDNWKRIKSETTSLDVFILIDS